MKYSRNRVLNDGRFLSQKHKNRAWHFMFRTQCARRLALWLNFSAFPLRTPRGQSLILWRSLPRTETGTQLNWQGEIQDIIAQVRRIQKPGAVRHRQMFCQALDSAIGVVWLVQILHYMWDEWGDERQHSVCTASCLTYRAILPSPDMGVPNLCSRGRHKTTPSSLMTERAQ